MYKYRFEENKQAEAIRIDYSHDAALDIGLDFNARFCSLLVAQEVKSQNDHEYRFIDAMYVKSSEKYTLIKQLAIDFCEKYKNHRYKKVFVFGDKSGKREDAGMKRNYYDIIFDILRKNGWTVTSRVMNSYPRHHVKYQVINEILSGKNYRGPIPRLNKETCLDAIISIENTPVLNDNFEKDKRSERNEKVDQRFATHFSDIFDYMLFAKFKRFVRLSRQSSGGLSAG